MGSVEKRLAQFSAAVPVPPSLSPGRNRPRKARGWQLLLVHFSCSFFLQFSHEFITTRNWWRLSCCVFCCFVSSLLLSMVREIRECVCVCVSTSINEDLHVVDVVLRGIFCVGTMLQCCHCFLVIVHWKQCRREDHPRHCHFTIPNERVFCFPRMHCNTVVEQFSTRPPDPKRWGVSIVSRECFLFSFRLG